MSRLILFFFSSRRRHTRLTCDWSSDVCSSDLALRRTQSGPDTSHGCVAGRLWFESGRWGQGSPAGTKRIPAGGGDPFSLNAASRELPFVSIEHRSPCGLRLLAYPPDVQELSRTAAFVRPAKP